MTFFSLRECNAYIGTLSHYTVTVILIKILNAKVRVTSYISSPFVCFYCSCKFQMVFCCMRLICVCVKDLNQSKHKVLRIFCDYTRQPTFRRLVPRWKSTYDQLHAFIHVCTVIRYSDIDIISFKTTDDVVSRSWSDDA